MINSMKAPWVSVSSKLTYVFQQQPPRLVRWGFHSSPIGPLVIGITDKNVVCRIAFGQGKKPAAVIREWQKEWPKTEFVEDKVATAKTIAVMFDRASPLTLQMTGTKFQLSVWKALTAIPAGKTVSYAELARGIKNPKAARAVGTACGANPVAILVPCHRVIAANGGLGGFGGGLPLKRALLEAEKKKAA